MASESTVFGFSVAAVVVGLAILLYGAEFENNPIIIGGGIVVLVGIGLMAAYIGKMSMPEAEQAH